MKKSLSIVLVALIAISTASAQDSRNIWTLNTRAWCTNYWTSLIYGAARSTVVVLTSTENSDDAQTLERIIPSADLVFPIGIEKAGFTDQNDIQGPYYYAFGNPFLHIGDFAVGLDASCQPSVVGFYAGAYFKSQEIVFKEGDSHLRAFYAQPRAGIVLGRERAAVEAGVFYDKTIGCYSTPGDATKAWFSDGLGLDIALSFSLTGKSHSLIQFSMPFHNFLNENAGMFEGLHRRVGYIMFTERINL